VITPKRDAQHFRKLSLFGVVTALLLLPALGSRDGLLTAQNSRGKPYAVIVGTVWGPDDRPVYGVTVKIRRGKDKPNKARWEVYSDHHGEFEQRLPARDSDYILWVDLKGFKPPDGQPVHLVQEVTVHIYKDERQDVGLHLAH
jgi:hypothetical protein